MIIDEANQQNLTKDLVIKDKKLRELGKLNLSKSFQVKKRHADLLQKGISFAPVNKNTPFEQFSQGIEKFIRTMKLGFQL